MFGTRCLLSSTFAWATYPPPPRERTDTHIRKVDSLPMVAGRDGSVERALYRGITRTLITDSHAITLPSLPLWVIARRRNSTGLTLARSTFGFDGSLDDGLVWL